MVCDTGYQKLIGAYFFGWVFFLIFGSFIADTFGRKLIFSSAAAIQVPVCFGVLFAKNEVFRVLIMGLSGLSAANRQTLGFVYM